METPHMGQIIQKMILTQFRGAPINPLGGFYFEKRQTSPPPMMTLNCPPEVGVPKFGLPV